jgi:predicted nuclease with RNAse H fold
MVIIGLDLAGVESRPTGVCILQDDLMVKTRLIYTDDDIVRLILTYRPFVTAIDAPLFLPKGRSSLEDRTGPHLRVCDKILLNSGIRFFPLTLGPMRRLTSRGINLKMKLNAVGLEVIEVYPGGAQDVLGIPKAKYDPEGLKNGLVRLGLKGLRDDLSLHELDAITAAYVGYLYCIGEYLAIGDPSEGYMIMPKSEKFKLNLRE